MKKKKTRKKVIKCIVMHDSASKLCVREIRRRTHCSRYLLQRAFRIEYVNNVTNRKVFFNFFFSIIMKNFNQYVCIISLMIRVIQIKFNNVKLKITKRHVLIFISIIKWIIYVKNVMTRSVTLTHFSCSWML